MKELTSTVFTVALLACAAGDALARNDKLMLPVDPALRHPATRQVLGPDVALRFGKVSGQGVEVLSQIQAHAVADPWANTNLHVGRRDKLSDEQVCLNAFRKAAAELQQKARAVGGAAVAGIVSFYNNVEMDSAAVYECHVGHTRAVVTLKGQVVRAVNAAATTAAVPTPAPAVAQPAVSAPAVQPRPIASGYAAIDDVDALPYLSDKGREGSVVWVKEPR